jgi:uncharacterized protein YndB with AHSA1/START domain
MPGLMIEREILIEAPVEVVWRTITEPDQVSQWFADRVELVVEPGAHGYMEFGDQGGPVVVEVVDPPTRFSFRWNHHRDEEPVAGNSMLVEFTLTPGGDERPFFVSSKAATSCAPGPMRRRSVMPTSIRAAGVSTWIASPRCSRNANRDDDAGR